MVLGSQRNRDDPEKSFRSMGSDCHPSGQSRKVSIGIMAEEQLRKRAGARKEDVVAVKSTNKGASGPKVVEDNNRKSEIVAPLREKLAEGSHQKTSPWVAPKSFSPKIPTARTVQFYAKQTSVLDAEDGPQKKFNRVNREPRSEVVQLYAKQSLILQSSNGVQQKYDGITYGRRQEKGGDGGDTERVEEFTFAAAQEVHMSHQGAREENKENRVNQNCDSLKQKLWEALETVPSQNEKNEESKDFEEETEDLNPEKLIHNSSKGVKRKQNSDPIETDSESPNANSTRPMTRSLSRKKCSTAPHSKAKRATNNGDNLLTDLCAALGHQDKNIFTFNQEEEERSGSLHRTSNPSSAKKSDRKYNAVEPRKIFFSGGKNLEKNKQRTDKEERPAAESKTPSHSSRVEKSHSNPSENNRENLRWPHETRKEVNHHSSENKKGSRREALSSPELPNNSSPQEDLWSHSSKKKANPQDGVDSPTFEMKTAIKESLFTPQSPKSIQIEQDMQSPAPDERRFTTNSFYNLRTRQKSNRGSFCFNPQADSSDDTQDPNESPARESSPINEAADATHKSSQSSEDREEESSEEVRPVKKGVRSTRMKTAGSDNPEKSPLIVHPSKRVRRNGLGCLSPSQKGTEDLNELLQPSDQNQDGLPRAVALFALALERFKTRMHTQKSKKSTEILASLSEEIQSQLQNVNSQIQKDVFKFTNLGKSKRKNLETKFQEQQERLKSIQERFKEEVSQHLQECKNTLEDLEAFQLELKGDAKRQKGLHQKLLLQVEEAIQAQLNDADRRITAIHKVSREKMSQLRHVITECLKEGVFD